jgi:hypothetical protein
MIERTHCNFEPAPDESVYVYFVVDPMSDAMKVGLSNDPAQRVASLQTAHAYPLTFIGKARCDSLDMAQEAERYYHSMLRCHRIRGEWFSLECKRVQSLIDWFASKEMGVSPL